MPHDLRHEHGQAGPRASPPVAVGHGQSSRNSMFVSCSMDKDNVARVWRYSHTFGREGDRTGDLLRWSRRRPIRGPPRARGRAAPGGRRDGWSHAGDGVPG